MAVAKVQRKPGDRIGSSDASPPQHFTEYMLSRVLDILDTAPTPEEKKAFWDNLAYYLKLDFNYSRWTYEAPDPWHYQHELCCPPYMCLRPLKLTDLDVPPTPTAPDPQAE